MSTIHRSIYRRKGAPQAVFKDGILVEALLRTLSKVSGCTDGIKEVLSSHLVRILSLRFAVILRLIWLAKLSNSALSLPYIHWNSTLQVDGPAVEDEASVSWMVTRALHVKDGFAAAAVVGVSSGCNCVSARWRRLLRAFLDHVFALASMRKDE